MTAHKRRAGFRVDLLERILDTVDSIERNVQELLDRVGDHIDDNRYRADWGTSPTNR